MLVLVDCDYNSNMTWVYWNAPWLSSGWLLTLVAHFHAFIRSFILSCQPPTGPEGTCWEDGVFVAKLSFPHDYPLSPPKMKFVTDLFHPNIYPDGRVCISILHAPGEDPMGYETSAERYGAFPFLFLSSFYFFVVYSFFRFGFCFSFPFLFGFHF